MTELPTSTNSIGEKRGRQITVYVAWIIALLLAISLYFYWNPPLQRAASNLKPGILALFFLASFTGFGLPISRRFLSDQDKGTQFLSAAAFGIGLTGIYVYLIGLSGHLLPHFFLAWSLLGFLLFCFYLLKLRPDFQLPTFHLWNSLSAVAIALFLVQSIPFVMAPEVTTDALEFHVLVPKIYLVTKQIAYIPRLVESNYPSLAEYNYTLIIGLSNTIACKCFNFLTGILLLFAIGNLVKKVSPESPASLAPAFFISMPVAAIVIGWAWNDLLFAFFVVMCVSNLVGYHVQARETPPVKSLLLAGTMGGLASCTKYTFVMVFLVLCLLFLVGIVRWRWKWKHFFVFVIPVGALSCIWMGKNFAFTGNPFYPFLNEIFKSEYWNPAANHYFRNTLSNYELPNWNWKTNFLFPFQITLKPRIMDVHVGILPLLLIPTAFVRTKLPGMAVLKAFVVCYLVVWLMIRTEVRSLLSLFAVLWTIYAAGLPRLRWPNKTLEFCFVAGVVISFIASFFMTIFNSYYLFDPLKYFFGREGEASYRSRLAETQGAYDFLNQKAAVGKVLLVGMHNPYYLRYEPVFSSCCDPPVAEWISSQAKGSVDIAARVRNYGITHVIFNQDDYQRDLKGGLYSWPPEQKQYFEEFLSGCKPLGEFKGDVVMEIPPDEKR